MRLRNKPWAQDKLNEYPQYVPAEPTEYKVNGSPALKKSNLSILKLDQEKDNSL